VKLTQAKVGGNLGKITEVKAVDGAIAG